MDFIPTFSLSAIETFPYISLRMDNQFLQCIGILSMTLNTYPKAIDKVQTTT